MTTADEEVYFTPAERACAAAMMEALRPFFSFRHTVPFQYVYAFLSVACDEGLCIQDYARRAGINASIMSRQLSDLGALNRYLKPGFDLITMDNDPLDRRKSRARLTQRGRGVMQMVIHALQGAPVIPADQLRDFSPEPAAEEPWNVLKDTPVAWDG